MRAASGRNHNRMIRRAFFAFVAAWAVVVGRSSVAIGQEAQGDNGHIVTSAVEKMRLDLGVHESPFGSWCEESKLPSLPKYFQQDDVDVLVLACHVASFHQHEDSMPGLALLLDHNDKRVELAACWALARMPAVGDRVATVMVRRLKAVRSIEQKREDEASRNMQSRLVEGYVAGLASYRGESLTIVKALVEFFRESESSAEKLAFAEALNHSTVERSTVNEVFGRQLRQIIANPRHTLREFQDFALATHLIASLGQRRDATDGTLRVLRDILKKGRYLTSMPSEEFDYFGNTGQSLLDWSDLQIRAADALGQIGDTSRDTIDVLVQGLDNSDSAMFHCPLPDTSMRLGGPIGIAEGTVAGACAAALGRLGHKKPQTVAKLRTLLGGGSLDVPPNDKLRIAAALVKMGEPKEELIARITAFLELEKVEKEPWRIDGSYLERFNYFAAIEELGELGPKAETAIPALERARHRAPKEVHPLIDEAIEQIRPEGKEGNANDGRPISD